MQQISLRASGHWLGGAINILVTAVLVVMLLHVTSNALLRTFFGEPIANTLAMTQYWYMPIIALFGFVAAQSRDQHVTAEIVFDRLPTGVRRWVNSGVHLLCATIAAAFVPYSAGEALRNTKVGLTDGTLGLAIWPATFLVPLAFALLCIQWGLQCIRSIRANSEQDQDRTDLDGALAPRSKEESGAS